MPNNVELKMLWSVWDANPIVTWDYLGKTFSIDMKMTPIAVAILASHQLIAIVGDYDLFGSDNLLMYLYNGEFCKSYKAPDLGEKSQFGGAKELDSGTIEVLIGYYDSGVWKDMAGLLNLVTGSVEGVYRSY